MDTIESLIQSDKEYTTFDFFSALVFGNELPCIMIGNNDIGSIREYSSNLVSNRIALYKMINPEVHLSFRTCRKSPKIFHVIFYNHSKGLAKKHSIIKASLSNFNGNLWVIKYDGKRNNIGSYVFHIPDMNMIPEHSTRFTMTYVCRLSDIRPCIPSNDVTKIHSIGPYGEVTLKIRSDVFMYLEDKSNINRTNIAVKYDPVYTINTNGIITEYKIEFCHEFGIYSLVSSRVKQDNNIYETPEHCRYVLVNLSKGDGKYRVMKVLMNYDVFLYIMAHKTNPVRDAISRSAAVSEEFMTEVLNRFKDSNIQSPIEKDEGSGSNAEQA
jgi:hypothetical protein